MTLFLAFGKIHVLHYYTFVFSTCVKMQEGHPYCLLSISQRERKKDKKSAPKKRQKN